MRRLLDQDAQRERRRQMLLLDRLSLQAERMLTREIASTTQDMVKAWDVSGQVPRIDEHQKRIEAILKSVWSTSVQALAERISNAAQSKGRVLKNNRDRWELFVQEYIFNFGGLKIVQISETTREQVVQAVEIGREEGLGQREIAQQILGRTSALSKVRANVIARTETHSAGNYGALKQAEDTGLEMSREWVASQGPRTRTTHSEADGQIVAMGDPFTVGGFSLMYPGDPSGPASETVNCRCAQAFVVLD